MNNIYKYKVSRKKTILSGFATLMFTLMFFSTLITSIINISTITKGDFFIIIFSLIICLIFMIIAGFNFLQDFLVLRENLRNPNIIVDDESILLPFENEEHQVRLSFQDIKQCREGYSSQKKNKYYFIYISSKLNQDEKYRLYKNCMKSSDYQELKNILFKQIKTK